MSYPTGRPKVKAPIEPLREPTYATIDNVIMMLWVGLPLTEVRDKLLAKGLTEYQAFLAYKAARLVGSDSFWDTDDRSTPIG